MGTSRHHGLTADNSNGKVTDTQYDWIKRQAHHHEHAVFKAMVIILILPFEAMRTDCSTRHTLVAWVILRNVSNKCTSTVQYTFHHNCSSFELVEANLRSWCSKKQSNLAKTRKLKTTRASLALHCFKH